MEMAQAVQRNTKSNCQETVNIVEECMGPADVWHMGGVVQVLHEFIVKRHGQREAQNSS